MQQVAGHTKLARRFENIGGCATFAAGEHEYTQFGYQQLIAAGVGLLQPDVMWMGGPTEFSPTEFSKFVAFASAQSVAVVPHGGGVYGYYMAMAFEHIRLAEFMMISESADKFEPNFGKVFNRNEINLIRPYDRPTRPAGIS